MPDADPVTLEIFKHLFASVAEEMGATLGRTGFSANIKERRDYSCAIFDGQGRFVAQAAHIPVHLGAMPASVRAAIDHCAPFAPGDTIILNDPFLGGTHLPDITLVSPVFLNTRTVTSESVSENSSLPSPVGAFRAKPPDPLRDPRRGIGATEQGPGVRAFQTGAEPAFFVASRAHHADIGGATPGSMPLAHEIYAEGLILPPVRLMVAGQPNEAVWQILLRNVRTPDERRGDLAAQLAAQHAGARRLAEIVERYGLVEVYRQMNSLIAYTERMVRQTITAIPGGIYVAQDALDDGTTLCLRLAVTGDELVFDFTGSAPAVSGPLNAVRAIVESAALYVLRCLVGETVPANHGMIAPLQVIVPPGSVLDAGPPHAVAGGNVETSQRVVDVILAALAQALPDRIPAASQGTMNNVTFGGSWSGVPFAYYETIGGGVGAGPAGPGESGMHSHMTNTLNTPIEALESQFPVRVRRYAIRRGSGGAGRHRGGDGLHRELEFLVPVHITLLSERRVLAPPGLAGGEPGQPGQNCLLTSTGVISLPGQCSRLVQPGEVLSVQTPGAGGWGKEQADGN